MLVSCFCVYTWSLSIVLITYFTTGFVKFDCQGQGKVVQDCKMSAYLSIFTGVLNCCITKKGNKVMVQGGQEVKQSNSCEYILTESDFFPLRDTLSWRKAS